MGLSITTDTESLPLTLGELRAAVGYSDPFSDTLLRQYLFSAWRMLENATGLSLLDRTYEWSFRKWPAGRVLELPRAPLDSVTSVEYYASGGDNDQALTTWATTNYRVTTQGDQPGFIEMFHDKVWPALDDRQDAAVITFIAGYGAGPSAVPTSAKNAIAMMVRQQLEPDTPRIGEAVDSLVSHLMTGTHYQMSHG